MFYHSIDCFCQKKTKTEILKMQNSDLKRRKLKSCNSIRCFPFPEVDPFLDSCSLRLPILKQSDQIGFHTCLEFDQVLKAYYINIKSKCLLGVVFDLWFDLHSYSLSFSQPSCHWDFGICPTELEVKMNRLQWEVSPRNCSQKLKHRSSWFLIMCHNLSVEVNLIHTNI